MAETGRVYRGLRNGRGDKRVEVVEVNHGFRAEPSAWAGIVVVPLEEDVAGTVRGLAHPTGEPGYDWPGSPGGEGAARLAEALLHDAGEGRDPHLYASLAEEYAAEWVNELPLWSGPFIDEAALYLGREGWNLMESLMGEGRRRHAGPSASPGALAGLTPGFRLPADASPEDVYEALTEHYYEDWRLYGPEVRRWAEDRAALHAEVRGIIEGGGGLVLIDLYGALARRLREIAVAAGREGDVVSVGARSGSPGFNLLAPPQGLPAEDLALLVAGAAETVWGWPEPESLDDPEEDLDEEEREEALASLLLEDALLTLATANGEIARGRGADPARRYTIFDARGLIEPSSAAPGFFSELLPLLGDAAGSFGGGLAASWRRRRSLPPEATGARPVLSLLEELEEEPWASAFAETDRPPVNFRTLAGAGTRIVLVDLSGAATPGRASEFLGAVMVRLAGKGLRGVATPPPVFLNGRHRHAPFPLVRPGKAEAFALEARFNGADVRPC